MAETSGKADAPMNGAPADPFEWLEVIEGDAALDWVRAENTRSKGEIEADPRFPVFKDTMLEILNAEDRIPYGSVRDGFVYNFWQDEMNVRGVWRRTPLESYKTDAPDWETLLDIDALAKAEDENWVYEGVDCLEPDNTRCLVALSRGGTDASVIREFDLPSKSFVDGGFMIPEAKSGYAWESDASLLVGTDWTGDGATVTDSGYPRIVKRVARGQALDEAETVFEGEQTDVGVWPAAVSVPGERFMAIVRAVSFFETEYYFVTPEGPKRLPLPKRVDIAGYWEGELLLTLQADWTFDEGKTLPAGALASFPVAAYLAGEEARPQILYEPGARASIQSVDLSGGRIILGLIDNVIGKVLIGEKGPEGWAFAPAKVPSNSTLSVVFASAFETPVFVNYETMTEPDTLALLDLETGALSALKSLPARFDPEGLTVSQFEATSADGTKIPYFALAPAGQTEPAPALLYGYGGFQISMKPSYSATIGKLWAGNGGVYLLANIRGGGEFGPAWHEAARR
ncbi:MAG: S9 family peptidase, partial [Pseudomonadota bacterium]